MVRQENPSFFVIPALRKCLPIFNSEKLFFIACDRWTEEDFLDNIMVTPFFVYLVWSPLFYQRNRCLSFCPHIKHEKKQINIKLSSEPAMARL